MCIGPYPLNACLFRKFTLAEDILGLFPCISIDQWLVDIRQVVALVFRLWVRLLGQVMHRRALLENAVSDINLIFQDISHGLTAQRQPAQAVPARRRHHLRHFADALSFRIKPEDHLHDPRVTIGNRLALLICVIAQHLIVADLVFSPFMPPCYAPLYVFADRPAFILRYG